jgi:glycosyltransferase involved in cell wall biosynthesis
MKKTILYVTIEPIEYRRRILNQIETARQAGFEVEIFSLGEKGKDYKESIDRLNVKKITVPLDKGPLKFIIFNLKLFFKFFLKKYDIVHFRGLWVIPAVILRQLFNKSILIYDANEYFAGLGIFDKRPIRRAVWLSIEKMIVKKVNVLITVSEPIAGLYKKRYPVLNKIEVIRNLPSYQIPKLPDDNSLRINLKHPFVLFHGYFMPGRGLENLIKAISEINNINLLLVGEGSIESSLRLLVKKLNLEHKVHFQKFVGNDFIVSFASQADVGVSLLEPVSLNHKFALPNKFFEYIMAGVPVLASRIPTLEEYISKYNVGMVTDPTDPKQISESIKSMIENPEQLREWKDNCFKAARILNWEKESQKLSSIYESFKL